MKQGKLIIAGKEYPVNFGVNYFIKYYNEATGKDALIDNIAILSAVGKDAINNTIAFLYAAHKAQCSIDKVPCDLTHEKAEELIMSLDFETTDKIYNQCVALFLGITEKDLNKIIEDSKKNLTAQAGKKKKS